MEKPIVLITGSTDGIGEETALKLAGKNYKIIIHGRNKKKAEKVLKKIKNKTRTSDISYVIGDFESFKDVEKMVKKIDKRLDKLDILINNAGVYENKRKITKDGFEKTFQINYLSPFYLTNMLISLILKSDNPKIVNVASMAHNRAIDFDNLQGEKKFNGNDAYGRSKLCNILFTFKLARRLKNSNAVVNCLHPGVINTKLLKKGWGGLGSDISTGADNVIRVVQINDSSGNYYMRGQKSEPAGIANNEEIQDKLWNKSIELIKNIDIEFEEI